MENGFFKNLFLTGKKHENGQNIVKTVVLIAIGAALYGIGGMISITIFANTSLKPAMGILALFAAAYGPVVGILSGFLGHILTDLFMGWGVWVTWAFGSALVGLGLGLYPIITKKRLDDGVFGGKEAGILILMSLVANFVGYLVSALLDYWFMGEPLNKVITQQLIVSVANTAMIAIVGCLLMKLVASRNKASSNLSLEDEPEK